MKKTRKIKVILIVATTADGYLARDRNEISTAWTSAADKKFFARQSKEIGFMVMGRPTYETIGFPLPQRVSLVYTRDEEKIQSPATWQLFAPATKGAKKQPQTQVIYINLPETELLTQLEAKDVSAVAICGGARIYYNWLTSGLVDEIYQTVEKKVKFGQGISFLPAGEKLETNYDLVKSIELTPETIVKHWRKKS